MTAGPELDTAVARLDDYVRRHAPDDAVTDYEDDLFARALAGQAPDLLFWQALAATVRDLDVRGTLDIWLTAREAARVRASGRRVVSYDLGDPAHPPALQIPPDAELLIARLPLDLTDVRALEIEVIAADGRILKRMPDIAFDRADGAIFACCDAALARVAASSPRLTRIWGTGSDGRRLLAEVPAF